MSKKGAFVYQQIEQTTAEWADNVSVYPASVWLFERFGKRQIQHEAGRRRSHVCPAAGRHAGREGCG